MWIIWSTYDGEVGVAGAIANAEGAVVRPILLVDFES